MFQNEFELKHVLDAPSEVWNGRWNSSLDQEHVETRLSILAEIHCFRRCEPGWIWMDHLLHARCAALSEHHA